MADRLPMFGPLADRLPEISVLLDGDVADCQKQVAFFRALAQLRELYAADLEEKGALAKPPGKLCAAELHNDVVSKPPGTFLSGAENLLVQPPPPPAAWTRPRRGNTNTAAVLAGGSGKEGGGEVVAQRPEGFASLAVHKKNKKIPKAQLPSRGSANHSLRQCRPCQTFFTPGGCKNGAMCNFCHFEHDESRIIEAITCSAKARERKSLDTTSADHTKVADVVFGEPWYVPTPHSSSPDTLPNKGAGSALSLDTRHNVMQGVVFSSV